MTAGDNKTLSLCDLTHPVIASPDHPLFAARKEGFDLQLCFSLTLFA
jgi:hypothetical protein